MLKVVLDSNIYISGILFKGAPRKVLNLVIEGIVESFLSEEILHEIRIVFQRKKFGLLPDNVHFIMSEIESITRLVYPKKHFDIIENDPDDNMILECAVEASADAIISGDNHLTKLMQFGNIEIMRADEFLTKYFT